MYCRKGSYIKRVEELHGAVLKESRRRVKKLLNSGVNPNIVYKGKSLLYFCLPHDDITIAQLLISAGADINYKLQGGRTILFESITYPNKDLFNLLIECGCDINTPDEMGFTPLYVAAAIPSSEMNFMKVLLEKGASVNAKSRNRQTVLYAAVLSLHIAKVRLLLNYNPDVYLMEHQELIHFSVNNLGILSGNVVDTLLDHGFFVHDCNARDPSFLFNTVSYGNGRLVEHILKRGLNPKLRGLLLNSALRHDHFDIFKRLLEFEIPYFNVNSTFDDETLIQREIRLGSSLIPRFIELLWSYGADINYRGKVGNSPLHIACSYENLPATEVILKFGGDVNIVNKDGKTPAELLSEWDWAPERLLRKHIQMLHSAGLFVSQQNLTFMATDWDDDNEKLLNELESEVKLMKTTFIPNTKISFFRMLLARENDISKRSNIKKIAEVLECDVIETNFKHFGDCLRTKISLGVKRRAFVDAFIENVVPRNNFFSRMPLICLDYIISLVPTEDLGIATAHYRPRIEFLSDSYIPRCQ